MSLHQQTIPPIIKFLKNLSDFLDKGAKFATEKGMAHEDMLSFRLVPDMRAIPGQVIFCCNAAKWLPVRLGVMEDVYFEDNESTFDQLQTRISKTIELLRTVDESKMNSRENEQVLMHTKSATFKFESGQAYVSNFALPWFHFHLSTSYCILRHLGVELEAFDYLGKDTFVKVDS